MRAQLCVFSRRWILSSLAAILSALTLAGCAGRKTSPKVETEPKPVEEMPEPPVVTHPQPSGPPAGSVWDVVTPDGRLPKDLLQVMAKQGAEVKPSEVAAWHTWAVDINDDGSKELFISNVTGWCGSGGCGIWLWQRTPSGLRNLLPTESILAVAAALGETGPEGYRDVLLYHRAMQNASKQSLVQDRWQWDGQTYRPHATTPLGNYLKTAIPEGAWRVRK